MSAGTLLDVWEVDDEPKLNTFDVTPRRVTVDSSGYVYIVDLRTMQKFDASGNLPRRRTIAIG